MCDFCKPDIFGLGGNDITKKIDSTGKDMGECVDVFQLELWLANNDSKNINPKLQACLSMRSIGDDLAVLDIPIEYCPMFGRYLK